MRAFFVGLAACFVACSSSGPSSPTPYDASVDGSRRVVGRDAGDARRAPDGRAVDAAQVKGDDASPRDAADAGHATASEAGRADARPDAAPDAGTPCTTRITYGSTWNHPPNHAAQFDDVAGDVTWDGTCTVDEGASIAVLSNGWMPFFDTPEGCVIALDRTGCGAPESCATRVAYGDLWIPPAGHPASYDDVAGRVFSDGECHQAGQQSYEDLSNGWEPHFSNSADCAVSFRYTGCGGLYTNPVIPFDCPDPGVLADGGRYVLTCTSGDAADAFPIFTSTNLATWTAAGHIFPAGAHPGWAVSDFWAPEIHHVGDHYVAYFSARAADGMLSVGVASASSPLGPFTSTASPLVHDAAMGHIDASEINALDGTPYALWKDDGNAIGQPTPIHAQQLTADGLSLVGAPSTLITNDQPWEGAVTEGPFMVMHGGEYFLFYSGNGYASSSYAVGVARASSPLGPFTKASGPILVSGGLWAGPGHCSVVDTPAGDTAMVYHAWEASAVGGGPGRQVLTDLVSWATTDGFPSVPLAPSSTTRPLL